MIKNDIYEIEIEDIGTDGEGIGHVNDKQSGKSMAVFVKDTVVGDKAKIGIVKVKKNYAYGRLIELISPSSFRVTPLCDRAKQCGGCSLMHMSYEKQLDYKWNKVKNCLERIGGLKNAGELMEPIIGMDTPFYYRNKMQFPVGLDKNGKVVLGFYAGRTHSIIDMTKCHIGHDINNYLIDGLRKWLQNWQDFTLDFIYDEEKHKGLVRHILTRVGFVSGELMVCVVINGDNFPDKVSGDCLGQLLEVLNDSVAKYNEKNVRKITLKSVSININKEKTNRILGDTCRTLWGQSYITDYIGDLQFRISPLSFYQVNPVQTKVLYDKAVEYAMLDGNETVWDMYCGIGTISLCLAKKAGKVYGVEIVPQAIEDAKLNAKINELTNVEFFCGKSEEVVPKFYAEKGIKPDVIVVDPPRKGCDKTLLDTIVEMSPERLVYVSCDPATLARDIATLTESGFDVEKVGVVDQFGHSTHVETVALLSQRKAIKTK